jgi:hypothetical protein
MAPGTPLPSMCEPARSRVDLTVDHQCEDALPNPPLQSDGRVGRFAPSRTRR